MLTIPITIPAEAQASETGTAVRAVLRQTSFSSFRGKRLSRRKVLMIPILNIAPNAKSAE
jgi:hypothetical protein